MALLFLCAALFFSCERQPSTNGQDRAAGAASAQAEQSDAELTRIAENARRTLPIFFRHLTGAGPGEDAFYVKYPFPADDGSGFGSEQVWLGGIHYKNGTYYGILAVEPEHLGGMKKGDTAAFNADSITDWMYVRDGEIVGGGSIKYLLEKIPEERRSEEQIKILGMF